MGEVGKTIAREGSFRALSASSNSVGWARLTASKDLMRVWSRTPPSGYTFESTAQRIGTSFSSEVSPFLPGGESTSIPIACAASIRLSGGPTGQTE